jgi:hypothetical protein
MKAKYTSIVSFLILVFIVYYAFSSLMPNKISSFNTPKDKYSTDRALHHLSKISQKPHFVGTYEHQKVKQYLIDQLKKLGLEVKEQNQLGINKKWRAATQTQNVYAKIKGTDSKAKSLLLLSHYDSQPHSSFGASDAGSGVVVILENIRAFLASGKKPKNDIIILFTDAEEVGLLGADAFVNNNDWIKNVGLVLNFEARGSGGPSYMLLETNKGNRNLIKAFNKAKPNFPVANSLMYSIYKMLPNDTDLTVFREDADINGFNFAFIDDHFDYHTAMDNYDRLDRNTLEQQGDYLYNLLNYFSDVNLENLNNDKDNIYFNFPNMGLINYPFSWNIPLFILALILFFAITFTGVQKQKLTSKAMFAGFVPFLSSLILSVAIATIGWKLLKVIYPQYNDIIHGFTYNGHLYIFAFSMLTIAITLFIYKRYLNLHSAANLMVAPIFVWGILNFFFLLKLPGAGFFIFPVYLGLLVLVILLFTNYNKSTKLLLATFIVIPVLIVFSPLVKMFPVGLGLKMLGVSAFFIVFLFGLLVPIFKQYGNPKKWAVLFLSVSLLTFVSASFKSGYSKDRKQPTSLIYYLDADNNKAYFASYESQINSFNKAYLTENPTKGSFIKNSPASKYQTNFRLYKETDIVAIPNSVVEVFKDTVIGSNRQVYFRITPQRKINRLELIARNTLHFNEFKVNGEYISHNNKAEFNTENRKTIITYYPTSPNEFLEIEFSIPMEEKPEIVLYESAYDLFSNPLLNVKNNRTEIMMPTPFVINDATIVKKEIKL